MTKLSLLQSAARVLGAVFLGVPTITLTAGFIYHENKKTEIKSYSTRKDLSNSTILITGATSGIGKATAIKLAQSGANIIFGSRNPTTRQETKALLLKAGAQTVLPFPLDTSSIQSVNSFCDAVLSSTPNGIDIILSAAAEIHTNKKSIQTPDGIDQSFATNHLGLHVLFRKLEPSILAKTKEQYNRGLIKPRIVIIGSRLETKGSTLLSIETLKTSNGSQLVGEATTYGRRLQQSTYEIPILSPMDRYAATKFSNMLLAQSLYDRWHSKTTSSSSISSASSSASPSIFVLTPGMVNTGLWRHFPTWYRILTYPLRAVALRSTEEAAMGVLYACTAMEAEDIPVANSYVYLSDGVSIEPSVPARDEKLAEQLFQVCDDLMNNRKEQQQQQIKETD